MKRAQIRMMESIFVMVIFLFIVGFGFVFYFSATKGSAEVKEIELQEQKSIEVALFISQLPELQCTEGGTVGGACIDLFKARALKTLQEHEDSQIRETYLLHYYDLFGFAEITLRSIYPSPVILEGTQLIDQIIVYSRPPQDRLRKAARTIFFPVTLKDIVAGEEIYSFGQLEVKVYT